MSTMIAPTMPSRDIQLVFAENIRRRRKELGLTQVELGKRCDLNQAYIAALESGTVRPRIDTVAVLAKSLNVSPDLLLREF